MGVPSSQDVCTPILIAFEILTANERFNPKQRQSVIIMLLFASRFSNPQWKKKAISRFKLLPNVEIDSSLRT